MDHVAVVEREGRALAAAARGAMTDRLRSCPEWTGGDLLAHTTAFARWAVGMVEGSVALEDPLPPVAPEVAAAEFDADLARLVVALRTVDPEAVLPNWSAAPPVAGFYPRRAAHEYAVHRWDAQTGLGEPDPIEAAVARDGVAEFFDVFVATALVMGMVPEGDRTLVFEATDLGERWSFDVRGPGPETVLRGTASDLLLGVWSRVDPVTLHVGGDRTVLEQWPRL